MLSRKPTIKPRTNTNKKTGVQYHDYEIHFGYVNGNPIRRYAKTIPEAEALAKREYMKLLRQTEEAMALSASQINECAIAYSILRDNGCHDSIVEIVREHIKRVKERTNTSAVPLTTIGTLKLAYDAALKKKTLSDDYRVSIAKYLRRFEEAVGKDAICANLTTQAVVDVLEKMTEGGAPKTFDNALGYASTMFNWGVKNKQIAENPLAGAERKRAKKKKPCFSLADTVQAMLLEGMEAPNADKYMPWLIIGFFCGIRVAEIGRLTWESIDWEERIILVEEPKGHLNGCPPRVVTLNDTAFAWLTLYRKDSGSIGGSVQSFGKWKCKLKSYVKGSYNVMRHTFGTMHRAKHKDIHKTANELGHYQNIRTSLNYYCTVTKPSNVEAFWALRPPVKAEAAVTAVPAAEAPQEPKVADAALLPGILHEGVPVASAV